MSFLQDQRGPRFQCSLLNWLRLRPGTDSTLQVSPEETLAREQEKNREKQIEMEVEREMMKKLQITLAVTVPVSQSGRMRKM